MRWITYLQSSRLFGDDELNRYYIPTVINIEQAGIWVGHMCKVVSNTTTPRVLEARGFILVKIPHQTALAGDVGWGATREFPLATRNGS
jgi:hypothetical protein